LFVYGLGADHEPKPEKYPARQTRAAGEAVMRLHRLDPSYSYHAQQKPEAVDAGVFHNDVIAVGNRELLLYHEQAFVDAMPVQAWLRQRLRGRTPVFVEIKTADVSIEDAVTSYLFNSQLICTPDGQMWLVCAHECADNENVWRAIQRIVDDPENPIAGAKVFDLRQSMRNGGGPACLRLRVVLTPAERAAVNPKTWVDKALYTQLDAWICKHYRDRLVLADLADPQLLEESRTALDALTQILGLGSLYDFQR
jgi:succinylarginine dihydrolase